MDACALSRFNIVPGYALWDKRRRRRIELFSYCMFTTKMCNIILCYIKAMCYSFQIVLHNKIDFFLWKKVVNKVFYFVDQQTFFLVID